MNNLLVTIDKKLYDTITFDSGITLHIDPNWHPEEFAMLTATVKSVPRGVIDRQDYEGITVDVKPGDTILMRYDVVFSYKNQPDRDSPIYKNLVINYNEETRDHEELWICDIQKVLAVIRGGKYIMQNGYVMVEPIQKDITLYKGRLWTPDHSPEKKHEDRVKVLHIGMPLTTEKDLGVRQGDTVFMPPGIAMKYQIDQNSFWIIRQRHILAKAI